MYLDYFSLQKRPFLISPDPAFLYPSYNHREALAHLHYGLEREGGFLLLSGEVGTGKTTLCRLLIEQLPKHFRLAYILNAQLDSAGVLRSICKELGIDITGVGDNDVNHCVELIYDNLLQSHSRSEHTLVIIEEAQNLDPGVLEMLRLLTNLETSSTKLLHILMIGQPEILQTLARPGLRQLTQRVVSRYHLGPLLKSEIKDYLDFRIEAAGGNNSLFTDSAARQIYKKSGGVPRLINILAERSLVGAYADNLPLVTAGVVRKAADELAVNSSVDDKGLFARGGVTALLVLVLVAVWWQKGGSWLHFDKDLPVSSVQAVEASQGQPNDTVLPVDASLTSTVSLPDDTTDASDPASSVFDYFLQLWRITGTANSLQQVCELASIQGFACSELNKNSLDTLIANNLPSLVTLRNDREGLDYFVLDGIDGNLVSLANSAGKRKISFLQFSNNWNGDAVFIWQPPRGYARPLSPGDRNNEVVKFLLQSLTEQGYLAEQLVTGGVYSDYLASRVKQFQKDAGLAVDGIVGMRTLIQLDKRAHLPALMSAAR